MMKTCRLFLLLGLLFLSFQNVSIAEPADTPVQPGQITGSLEKSVKLTESIYQNAIESLTKCDAILKSIDIVRIRARRKGKIHV